MHRLIELKVASDFGKIVWPSSMTRPDISMETSKLCSCIADPRSSHYDACLVVAGYLWQTKSLGITYGGKLRIPIGLTSVPVGFEESSGLYRTWRWIRSREKWAVEVGYCG